ncbi:MAG: nucleotide exchange factor GrpE [Clostridiales bacterium]|jgi:molecular chaperone GrpE (heat shock protein)|nr:nucleotide exchange factor GrpE [Clostridiales bacterium]
MLGKTPEYAADSVFSQKKKELAALCTNYANKIISRIFLLIQNGAKDKLEDASNEFSVFLPTAENPYNYCRHLMDSYLNINQSIATLQASFLAEPVRSIFIGIASVLESRLNDFNEEDTAGQNPIALEKLELTQSALEKFAAAFDEFKNMQTSKAYISKYAESIIPEFMSGFERQSAVNFVNSAAENISRDLFGGIYGIFNENADQLIKTLNNMEKRPQITKYFDILKNEFDELSTIIKQQIFEIETRMLLMDREGGEYKAAFEILTLFRETYQHTGNSIGNINELMESLHNKSAAACSFDDFCAFLKNSASAENVFSVSEFDGAREEFLKISEELRGEYAAELRSLSQYALAETSFGHVIYQVKKHTADNKALACGLKDTFGKIIIYFEENESLLKSLPNFDIIRGIYDTVKIKVVCLEENTELLSETELSLLSQGQDKIQGINAAEIEKAAGDKYLEWLLSENDNPAFAEVLESQTYLDFMDKRKKQHDTLLDTAFKKSTEYKKEYLLFEVSTYEEIINYSVSRLKEAEQPETLSFAQICADVYEELLSGLKRNNIIPIRPAPHDMFSAKEHEVLMAEKNDEFQKGEIIKLMNSGYKQEETVIMRANVIAAK